MEVEDKKDLEAELQKFSGSEFLFKHKILNSEIKFTDGVRYIAEKGQAWWVLDLVLSYQWMSKFQREEFQSWTLMKNRDQTWTMTCTDGRDKVLCKQEILYSDFPLEILRLWLINEVCMLPSEY